MSRLVQRGRELKRPLTSRRDTGGGSRLVTLKWGSWLQDLQKQLAELRANPPAYASRQDSVSGLIVGPRLMT